MRECICLLFKNYTKTLDYMAIPLSGPLTKQVFHNPGVSNKFWLFHKKRI